MSNRSSELLIEDILESAKKIQRYTAEMTFEQFTEDEKTADAVVRNFEIIARPLIVCLKNLRLNIQTLIGIE